MRADQLQAVHHALPFVDKRFGGASYFADGGDESVARGLDRAINGGRNDIVRQIAEQPEMFGQPYRQCIRINVRPRRHEHRPKHAESVAEPCPRHRLGSLAELVERRPSQCGCAIDCHHATRVFD